MYYANAEFFTQEVLDQVTQAEPPLSWLCIDGVADRRSGLFGGSDTG